MCEATAYTNVRNKQSMLSAAHTVLKKCTQRGVWKYFSAIDYVNS